MPPAVIDKPFNVDLYGIRLQTALLVSTFTPSVGITDVLVVLKSTVHPVVEIFAVLYVAVGI